MAVASQRIFVILPPNPILLFVFHNGKCYYLLYLIRVHLVTPFRMFVR